MSRFRIQTQQEFVQYLASPFSSNLVPDGVNIADNSIAYNNDYGALRINDASASLKGALTIPITGLKIGDRVDVFVEFFSVSGVKPKVTIDRASGGNLGVYQSKKQGVFESFDVSFVADRDDNYEIVVGTFTADVGDFYVRNLTYALPVTQLFDAKSEIAFSDYEYRRVLRTGTMATNKAFDIFLPKSAFSGELELNLLSGNFGSNATGRLTKKYNLNLTTGGVITQNTYFQEASRTIVSSFILTDLTLDVERNMYKITIYNRTASNPLTVIANILSTNKNAKTILTSTIVDSDRDLSEGETIPTTVQRSPLSYTYYGTESPEGRVTAVIGSMYINTLGGANTTLYIKVSGSGNVGWVAK